MDQAANFFPLSLRLLTTCTPLDHLQPPPFGIKTYFFLLMSLVTDTYLLQLWKAAQAASDVEAPGRTFWNQVLSKYIFVGKEYVVSSEEPPSSASTKRRVDIIVKYFESPKYSIRIFCFVEAKRPNADLSLIDEVEHQAFDACVSYLSTNKLQHIYAMTTVGTRARLWKTWNFQWLCGWAIW